MNPNHEDINSKMEKVEDQKGDENDHKPASQDRRGDGEEKQDNNEVFNSEEEEASKKKRRKESFSLGCQLLHK